MARPRKPVETLKLTGQYKPSRHSARAAAPCLGGSPVKPRGLSADAGKFWDRVVPKLVEMGVATRSDSEQLGLLCRWWAVTDAALKLLEHDPSDKEAGQNAARASKAFQEIAVKFGLTPVDRERLTPTKPAEDQPKVARRSG